MKSLIALMAVFSLTLCVAANPYPALREVWNISLGGDLIDIRDVTGDGQNEITIGLLRGQSSYAYLLDSGGGLLWRNKISVIWPQNNPNTLIIDDLDGNNNTDIIVASVVQAKSCYGQLSPYANPLFVLERDPQYQNNVLKWVNRGYGMTISMAVADLDGQGQKQVITGARDGHVWVVGHDGSQRWKYKTEGTVGAVHVTDLNNDGIPEILAGSFQSVIALSNLGTRIWRYRTPEKVVGLASADVTGDGLKEVFATGDNDTVFALSSDGSLLWIQRVSSLKSPIVAADINGDSQPEVIVASADYIHAFDRKGQTLYSFNVGYPIVNMGAAQLSQKGKKDLVIVGARRITSYEINPDYMADLQAKKDMETAIKYHKNGSFELARNHALAAYEVFTKLKDEMSASEAKKLNISSQGYIRANGLLADARGNYSIKEFHTARELAIEAQRIYISLSDPDMTDESLGLANMAIDQIEAETLYRRALDHFRAAEYVLGSIFAQRAHAIYESLNETLMMEKSNLLIDHSSEYPQANKRYDEAFRQLEAQRYAGALENAKSALESYEVLGDEGRIISTKTLISRIEDEIERQDTLSLAKTQYENALKKASQRNYQACVDEAQKSQKNYDLYDMAELSSESKNLISRCERGIEAQMSYKTANDLLIESKQETAMDYALRARQIFRAIDDADGAIQASEFMDAIKHEQALKQMSEIESQKQQRLLMILSLAGLMIAALLAYFIIQRISQKKPVRSPNLNDMQTMEDYTSLLPDYNGFGEQEAVNVPDKTPDFDQSPDEIPNMEPIDAEREDESLEDLLAGFGVKAKKMPEKEDPDDGEIQKRDISDTDTPSTLESKKQPSTLESIVAADPIQSSQAEPDKKPQDDASATSAYDILSDLESGKRTQSRKTDEQQQSIDSQEDDLAKGKRLAKTAEQIKKELDEINRRLGSG